MTITRNQYRLATVNAAKLQSTPRSKWFLNLIILKSLGVNVYSRKWNYARLFREQLYAHKNGKESKELEYYLTGFVKEYENDARIFRARVKYKKYGTNGKESNKTRSKRRINCGK